MPPLQTNRNRHFSERFVGAAYMRPAELPPPQASRAACMPPLRTNPPTPFFGTVCRGRIYAARGVPAAANVPGGMYAAPTGQP